MSLQLEITTKLVAACSVLANKGQYAVTNCAAEDDR